jgi:dTDP-4-amino-4,6-dideoxygalactose transaminase
MTEFSLHPVKHITTGEGGVITTDNYELYQRLSIFRTHGITRDSSLLSRNEGSWYYEQLFLGYNYRITDIQCALGVSQLNKLETFVKRRREIAKLYDEAFEDMPEIITPCNLKGSISSYHLYVIQLVLERLNVGRAEIFEALKAENIGVNVHYIPVYYHPYYTQLGYKKGICPIAEDLYDRIITLPLFPKMDYNDVKDVINAVRKVINYYQKS